MNRIGLKIPALIMALLIIFNVSALTSAASSDGYGNRLVAESKEVSLALYKNNAFEEFRFNSVNMFPGDEVNGTYNLDVSFVGTLTVHFSSVILPGYEKLAEVLKCKVILNGAEAPVYDGLMKDMPEKIDTEISSESKTTQTLTYDIIVYLDTDVGNEYQYKQLICDFRWWVEEEETTTESTTVTTTESTTESTSEFTTESTSASSTESTTESTTVTTTRKNPPPGQLIDPPDTGDSTQIGIILSVLAVSSFVFVLSLRKRKEETHG